MPFDLASAKPAGGGFDLSTAKPVDKAKDRKWSDVPGEALSNLLPSAGNLIGGIASAVAHPIDTIGTLGDVAAGALQNALPAGVKNAIDRIDPNPKAAAQAVKKADAAGAFFKDRYGSMEGLKNTLATDPVGAASDAAAILTGGAGLAKMGGKLAQAGAMAGVPGAGTTSAVLSGTGQALSAASGYVNPLSLAGKGLKAAAPIAGNALANAIGGLGTHTGAESIKQAFKSGKEGGVSAKSLADNMRGNVPMTDVLDAAKANLDEMGKAKSAAYRSGMAQVSGDQTVLNFSGIDNAVASAAGDVRFGAQIKNVKAAAVQQQIADEVANWKSLDPAQYHTPEGLDALKQKIGGIVDSIPYEEKAATRVGTQMYNAVKNEIVQQAPVYAKTMREYSDATEQIREIERALSLGSKSSVDTAMRKLQSLTRNNVNTNYSNRLALAQQMEQQGGNALMPALAGQALTSWTPRGIGGAVAGGTTMGAYALGNLPAAAATLAVQSPRLMGEVALAAGKGAGAAGKAGATVNRLAQATGMTPTEIANYLAIAGRGDQ